MIGLCHVCFASNKTLIINKGLVSCVECNDDRI